MKHKWFDKTRKALTSVAVVALVAGVSYGISGLLVTQRPAFALTANKSFDISSTVYSTYSAGGCSGAHTIAVGVTACLEITVENPLSVAIEVRSLSMTVTTFTPTSSNHHTPPCTTTMLTVDPTTLTHTFTVPVGGTHTIDKPITLEDRDTTQDNCLSGTFNFTFTGTATFTDTTMTTLTATPSGSTAVLTATVTPANPSADPYGPASTTALVHHVTFFSCATSSCASTSVLATVPLTTTTPTTLIAKATYDDKGLGIGTHYFEVAYPAIGTNDRTFAGSTSTPEAVIISTSSAGIPFTPSPTSTLTTPLPPPAPPPGVTVVGGVTADTTAAKELTRVFPYAKGVCPTTRAVVVATTKVFQDALSSQYLAQHLTTGTLLTPTLSLSPITATMIRKEGVNTVYIVGGPLAVDTTVAKQIADLTAYECGGTTKTPTTGKVVVHRIWGKTQFGTAKAVADFVGTGASLSFTGAYATTDATGGTGRFNDTAGKGTSAPGGTEPTAILANGDEFQDAQAASVISYRTKIPLLLTSPTKLTTTAVGPIKKLGIKQVILMGGTMAVTNALEATLVKRTGVSVLRIAGTDYTGTAVELARFEADAAPDGLGWTPDHRILVARGNGFTDGIAGGDLESPKNTATGAAGAGRPLLLTESPTVLGTSLTSFLKVTGHTGIDGIKGKTVTDLTVLGGPLAVSTTEIAAMQTDLAH